jgi:hypothetical protein
MQSFAFVEVESCKNLVAMKILFYFIICLVAVVESEPRLQKSIFSIIEKCIPNENNIKLNFVYENITSDEIFHLLFTTFQKNQERFFSNKW